MALIVGSSAGYGLAATLAGLKRAGIRGIAAREVETVPAEADDVEQTVAVEAARVVPVGLGLVVVGLGVRMPRDGRLDETDVVTSTVESDEEWGEGRHWPADTSGARAPRRITYPVPVGALPTALGDGTWCTTADDGATLLVWSRP
ncbi:hypothetical protein [Actinacidiphila glaucinigra]|uniref:hypothetical protein n=1 Tax=Actinacidiphila glaucinigra TaxID=235986 RepID=UPI0037118ED0